MRLTLILAAFCWRQILAEESKQDCKGEIAELATTEDDFCNMAGLSGKKLEDDLSWNDLKKCCGVSNHFKYDCVRYDTHCKSQMFISICNINCFLDTS